jgi:phage regulator Rha-like protein
MKKDDFKLIVPEGHISPLIHTIRGVKVILDQDLAALYGVRTKVLNQAVTRNLDRLPEDFAFRMNEEEVRILRSQIVTSSWGGRRSKPFAFTEHGVLMAANLLKSKRASLVSVAIVRAFVRLRHYLNTLEPLTKELTELKSFVLKHANANDREFRRIWQMFEKMELKKAYENDKEQNRIGFDLSQ